jgi:DNA-binding response OmpR family regulator
MKIVIVDDDPTVLQMLCGLFQRKGHSVLTYNNPAACPIFKQPHGSCFPQSPCPDIIITDFDMPDVDGIQFIETVFKKGCKCQHVALLTGVGVSDQDMRRLAKYGTRFFTKPLDFAEFEAWMMIREKPFN